MTAPNTPVVIRTPDPSVDPSPFLFFVKSASKKNFLVIHDDRRTEEDKENTFYGVPIAPSLSVNDEEAVKTSAAPLPNARSVTPATLGDNFRAADKFSSVGTRKRSLRNNQ